MTDNPFPPIRPHEPPDAERRRRDLLTAVRRRRTRRGAVAAVAACAAAAAVIVPVALVGGRPASERLQIVQPGPGTTATTTQPVPVSLPPVQVTVPPIPETTVPPPSTSVAPSTSTTAPAAASTWHLRAVPPAIAGNPRIELNAVTCPTSRRCVAVGGDPADVDGGVVVESDDGGATWSLRNRLLRFGAAYAPDLYSVTCPASSRCIAVGSGSGPNGEQIAVAVVLTGTTGASAAALPPGMGSASGITCPTTTVCLVAGNALVGGNPPTPDGGAQIARSTDAGATWSAVPAPAGMADGSSIACTSATRCILGGQTAGPTASSQALASVSTDGGATWGPTAPAGQVDLVAISCAGADCVGVDGTDGTNTIGQGAVVQSRDGGLTWTTRPGLSADAVACEGSCVLVGATDAGPQAGYPATAEISDDGGTTWRSVRPPAGMQDFTGVAWTAPGSLVAVGTYGTGNDCEIATFGP